ncbi:MAG: glutamine--fructose-6-phosphate transaminase (isomerizing) [Erysipelotrichaceae bacterium]|nr:glutamine--fructose-6-phosphate transaminase (isomerizing) [Erysipelotrichaceae bacterium]
MCGITGFTGTSPALPVLMQGLEKLEYRGYDSAGITLADKDTLITCKAKGRLSELRKIIENRQLPQCTGIGHTRWATHGVPNNLNAHPHTNSANTISLVHNGIIENYASLKQKLENSGYVFQSETDSEAVVHLIDHYYRRFGDMETAFKRAVRDLEGSYGLCVISTYAPDTIFTARKESPMILGISEEGTYCASDAPALLEYTRKLMTLDDGDIAILRPDKVTVYDAGGNEKKAEWKDFPYDVQSAQKGGYDTFMEKEIHEQPLTIRETLRGRIEGNTVVLPELDPIQDRITQANRVLWIACGTAYHACVYGQMVLNGLVPVNSIAVPASEFRYGNYHVDRNTLCIFVSQSGETADTLAAIKRAKSSGAVTVAVANVLGSSLTRIADTTVYTCAGLEIAVASTKAYTAQLTLLYLLALKLAEYMGYAPKEHDEIVTYLNRLDRLTQETIDRTKPLVREYAAMLKEEQDVYFIGRQMDYVSAMEGALKLKEISYIHADAYYAGELKHGPIALIRDQTVVVAFATQPEVAAKTISNIRETVARGAKIILVTDRNTSAEGFSYVIRIPEIRPDLACIVSAVIFQFLAYYTAYDRGCDIDKPRNLAKSVTVE